MTGATPLRPIGAETKLALYRELSPFSRPRFLAATITIAVNFSLLGLGLAGALMFSAWPLRLLSSLVAGLGIGSLYAMAHDAAHCSLLRSRWANRLVARLAFAVTFHSVSLWDEIHNYTHHGFTNLKGKDYVYAPLSPAEYEKLGPVQKTIYRFYRSFWGLAFWYVVELVAKRAFFPREEIVRKKLLVQYLDTLWLTGFLASWLYLLYATARPSGVFEPALGMGNALFGFLIPLWFGYFLVSFVLYGHHNHQTVPWFDKKDEWSYLEAQARCSTHVQVPAWAAFVFQNTLDHTAHHIQLKTPAYNLKDAQHAIESVAKDRIPVIAWSLPEYLKTIRMCKLYDFETHSWCDFQGNVTAKVLL